MVEHEAARRILVLKPDPLGIPRNPLAVYLLCLAFLSGLVSAVGEPTSDAMHTLSRPVEFVWSLALVYGAGSTLTGMYWPGTVQSGLLLKRIGMFSLMVAAFLYAVVILTLNGMGAFLTAGIVAGFGVACAVQFHIINKRIKAIILLSNGGT